MLKRMQLAVVGVMLLSLMGVMPASAGLPMSVDGQQVPSLAPLVKKVGPAVVNISTKGHVEVSRNPLMQDPFFRHFFNMPDQPQQQQQEVQALGSGVIVDADKGYILTNNHVIEHADKITVTLEDNRVFDAKVVGADPDTDIAVIKIDAKNLTALPLGDSEKLQVGDFVVAIGNPFGLDHTVTSGIVSGLGRARLHGQRFQNFIQTDAAINPGNSGGALIDLQGKLVGINSAILSQSGGNIGIGFAIPINMAKQVMEQLIKHGKIERGILGVRVQPLTPQMAEAFGVKQTSGALVAQVADGSPAEKAGLKQGDIITAVNGKEIERPQDLVNAIGLKPVGTKVELTIIRDGKELTKTATIGSPSENEVAGGSLAPHFKGATFSDLDERSPLFGKVRGVMVSNVKDGSPAAAAGLQEGDVVTSVNRQPVENLKQFEKAVKGKERLLLNVRRGNAALFILLQ